ncbi:hypothetical protein [Rossellomorea aquimaris]|uniref:hypothetical protein n=1 Tax=Rossellomorea aquimaris TaxID=189382 RepID=UPI001CFE3830|nr:hypothetical protein [Rossellomorea aquimaris]
MKNINDIRKVVDEAVSLKQGSTKLFREFNDSYRSKRSAIQLNNDYTVAGKAKLLDSAKQRETTRLMKLAREQREQFNSKLLQAKKDADAIIHAHAPKVDPVAQERFTKRFNEVKTQIALSNARKGQELLKDFLADVNEQAFAEQVKDGFSELIQPILNDVKGPDAERVRHSLFDSFEDIRVKSQSPEAGEAQAVAEYVDALIKGKFFEGVVEDKVEEVLGSNAKQFINDPDAYFEIYPKLDKPESTLKTVEEIVEEEQAKI